MATTSNYICSTSPSECDGKKCRQSKKKFHVKQVLKLEHFVLCIFFYCCQNCGACHTRTSAEYFMFFVEGNYKLLFKHQQQRISKQTRTHWIRPVFLLSHKHLKWTNTVFFSTEQSLHRSHEIEWVPARMWQWCQPPAMKVIFIDERLRFEHNNQQRTLSTSFRVR